MPKATPFRKLNWIPSNWQKPNCWELFAGTEKAEFSLRDKQGELSLDPPKVGDYFRIKVPGLHNPTGDGYDWVQVEKFEEEVFAKVNKKFTKGLSSIVDQLSE